MRRRFSPFIAAALIALGSAPTWAEETVCTGFLGNVTVGSLRVPDGARCRLKGTRVEGTLVVERGAILDASRIDVIGNVQAENARLVRVAASTIGQSVQLKQGGGASVTGSRIDGDLQLESNRSSLGASRNVIGGSLQAFQNTGGLVIKSNRIDGSLQCKENTPLPAGGGNVVHGNKEDQCGRL